jgi:hypothetical protein
VLKRTETFYKTRIIAMAEQDKGNLSVKGQRKVSLQKEAFMILPSEMVNHDGVINSRLPESVEKGLNSCLVINPAVFSDE